MLVDGVGRLCVLLDEFDRAKGDHRLATPSVLLRFTGVGSGSAEFGVPGRASPGEVGDQSGGNVGKELVEAGDGEAVADEPVGVSADHAEWRAVAADEAEFSAVRKGGKFETGFEGREP